MFLLDVGWFNYIVVPITSLSQFLAQNLGPVIGCPQIIEYTKHDQNGNLTWLWKPWPIWFGDLPF